MVSNHGPLPCEGSALPLSYTPDLAWLDAWSGAPVWVFRGLDGLPEPPLGWDVLRPR
ncbi:hypothetical protein FMEAI12_6440001 [Parafrankia sp. Ea1.12]|nr:hypothetical protein FMEAI12_6440001 [Parafrankia sp. Ea1.12]